ncbi:GGDEF domain-containing protein [candidate division WOR-3 bacterium]|nr:GGDEF domain-containing protein [candidate division WOR-3 bacterium]
MVDPSFEDFLFELFLIDSDLKLLKYGKSFSKLPGNPKNLREGVKITEYLVMGEDRKIIEKEMRRKISENSEFEMTFDIAAGERRRRVFVKFLPVEFKENSRGAICSVFDLGAVQESFSNGAEDTRKDLQNVIERRASNLSKTNKMLIDELKRKQVVEEELRYFASTDSLTGIYNRRAGLLFLDHRIRESMDNNTPFQICFVDVNNLKEINDSYGHNEGDYLLVKLTEILNQSIRESDVIFRLGGDEFIIIFHALALENTKNIWKRVDKNLGKYNESSQKKYEISVSYGFATFDPSKPKTIEELISFADFEMYREKEKFHKRQES